MTGKLIGLFVDNNFYGYVANDPVNFVDSEGLMSYLGATGNFASSASSMYSDMKNRRSEMQRSGSGSDGHANSAKRHYSMSYESTNKYGSFMTRIAGVANEIQGFIRWDLPNLMSRLKGDSPWAFSLENLINNERGIQDALDGKQSCP